MSDISKRYRLSIQVAEEAAALVRRHFGQGIDVVRKEDASPVTAADREAEALLRERIEANFPNDGIVGEEFETKIGTSPYRWILDPIDGTKSFISDVPLFGTMVAVEADGRGQIGVVNFPGLGVSIDAMVGGGAWETGRDGIRKPARVCEHGRLEEGVVLTTDWEGFRQRGAIGNLNAVAEAAWFMRTWGDCYGHYLVATGRAVAMIDARLNIWDAAALQPIIEEAGGTFTDWNGQPSIDSGDGISTNGRVLGEVLKLLNQN